jgi:hypothetical protein
LALDDPDATVREEAVGALAQVYSGPETLDAIILALGDPAWPCRAAVHRALLGHVADLSVDRLYTLADAACLLVATSTVAPDPTAFTVRVDDILPAVFRTLVADVDKPENLAGVAPARKPLLLRGLLLAVSMVRAGLQDDGSMSLDAVGEDEARAEIGTILAGLEAPPDFTVEDVLSLRARGPRPVAELALKVARYDAGLGARIAAFACFCDDRSASQGLPGDAPPAPAGAPGLADRLRGRYRHRDALAACHALTVTQGELPGIAGLAALVVLGVRGDDSARSALEDRVVSGGTGGWHAVLDSLLCLTPRHRRAAVASRVVSARPIPVAVRSWWYDHLDGATRDQLDRGDLVAFLHQAAATAPLPAEVKAAATRTLTELGEIDAPRGDVGARLAAVEPRSGETGVTDTIGAVPRRCP